MKILKLFFGFVVCLSIFCMPSYLFAQTQGGILIPSCRCPEGGGMCKTTIVNSEIIHNSGNIVYIDTVGNIFTGIGTITVSNGIDSVTMLDRNLGANIAGTGEDSFGYYFQWGNNYGFLSTGFETSDSPIDTSGYGPGNYYISGIFINIEHGPSYTAYDRSNPQNDNLWGGSGDNLGSSFPLDFKSAKNRQGPCPNGFHVPSLGEWDKINDLLGTDGNHISNSLLLPKYFLRSSSPSNVGWNYPLYGGVGIFSILGVSCPEFSNFGWADVGANRIGSGQIRCFKNPEPNYIEPIDDAIQVKIGEIDYNELPSTMTITRDNVQQVNNKSVLGEVSVSFGSNESAKFSKLVKVNIPVESAEQVIIKVKHAGSIEYNFDGLTLNKNASCSNGTPTSSQYNGEPITVVDGFASIYTCEASSFVALDVPPLAAKINLSVIKGTLTIGTEIGNLNLGEVNVSNSAQELSGSFGADSFWVEDMKGLETGYYTTISVTDLNGTVSGHSISASNVSLKTSGSIPNDISGATASEAKVIFGNGITDWHSGSGQVNYFQRLNTATVDAGRVGKWGDDLQIKVTIPAHTPYDTYRGTITYTLYDNDL